MEEPAFQTPSIQHCCLSEIGVPFVAIRGSKSKLIGSEKASDLRRVDDGGTYKASINSTIGYCKCTSSHLIDRKTSLIRLLCKGIDLLLYLSTIHLISIANNWHDKALQGNKLKTHSFHMYSQQNSIAMTKYVHCKELQLLLKFQTRHYKRKFVKPKVPNGNAK